MKNRKPTIKALKKILAGPDPIKPVAQLLSPAKKLSISKLTKLLNSEEDQDITILPNGEVTSSKRSGLKSALTFRENLGGEYAGVTP